jgi:glycosyltransferase involved in cell wall biosynthesis
MKELLVVSAEKPPHVERVRFLGPSPWLRRLLGPQLGRLIMLLVAGLRWRPDLYMGYHIMPNALFALIAGRLFSRPVCYQMTGGPNEIVGGGAGSENQILRRLGGPSPWLERLALAVVRQFDLVVVRGSSASRFLLESGVSPEQIAIIPGSLDPKRFCGSPDRPYDLVFVGRLAAVKQPLQFIQIVAGVRRLGSSIRSAVVGDGPLAADMHELARQLDMEQSVEFLGQVADVGSILSRSKIFVLTSRTEGLSIAMGEAMAAGVVPVVANVGDLGDLVRNGENGYLVVPNDVEGFARLIAGLLDDPELLARLSGAATKAAHEHMGVELVSHLWSRHLGKLLEGGQMLGLGSRACSS